MKKICVLSLLLCVPIVAVAAVTKKQSAIQNGTNVRARVAATGVYSQQCYDEYYGCTQPLDHQGSPLTELLKRLR